MNLGKWLELRDLSVPPGRVTRKWGVWNRQFNGYLGEIRWDTGWRRYVFAPVERTIFEEDCLRSISDFLESETAKRKKERAKA